MKVNWKVRLKNPTFWLTFAPTVLAFVYTMLAMFDITPSIAQDQILEIITLVISALATVGVLVDPTTSGIGDSAQALTYEKPKITTQK